MLANVITKKDLMRIGFKENTARTIIKTAKLQLVADGFSIYDNKKMVSVPTESIEKIIGTKWTSKHIMVTAEILNDYGYSDNMAKEVIKISKSLLVSEGYSLYENCRLGCVPIRAVQKVLSIKEEGI